MLKSWSGSVTGQQALPSGAPFGWEVLFAVGDVGQVDEFVQVADVGEEPVGPAGVGAQRDDEP